MWALYTVDRRSRVGKLRCPRPVRMRAEGHGRRRARLRRGMCLAAPRRAADEDLLLARLAVQGVVLRPRLVRVRAKARARARARAMGLGARG